MYRIGIDLGGTNIVAGVVDGAYNILAKAECKTAVPRPEVEICKSMAYVAKRAVHKANLTMADIESCGIGVPGAVNPKSGIVEYSVNLFFHNWNIADTMRELLKIPITIENDANAAAYGEYLAGAAKGSDNAVCITLGTGVGGGVIINGKLYSGSNFAGAELGHMVIVHNGKGCACGRRGCFEAYASSGGLISLTKEAIEDEGFENSYMLKSVKGDISKVNGITAFNAMRNGDKTGKLVVDRYISYLGCGITNVVNIFQPDIICIGGGISREGETLIAPLRDLVKRERYTKHNRKQTKIVKAKLGNDAGIIGAAMLFEAH